MTAVEFYMKGVPGKQSRCFATLEEAIAFKAGLLASDECEAAWIVRN